MPQQDDNRRFTRHAWRIPCVMRCEGSEYRGIIIDVSAQGFFVKTSALLRPDTRVEVLVEPDAGQKLLITGTVARKRKAHPGAGMFAQAGVGVRIESAPEAYYQLVLGFQRKD